MISLVYKILLFKAKSVDVKPPAKKELIKSSLHLIFSILHSKTEKKKLKVAKFLAVPNILLKSF